MTRLVKRGTLAAAVVGLVTLSAPTAHASKDNVVNGGCSFETQGDPSTTGEHQYVGLMYDVSVTTTRGFPRTPIGATVTCWIEINEVVVPGTVHSYGDLPGLTGVQAGGDRVTFSAGDDDLVFECESVSFADGSMLTPPCPTPLGPFIFPPPVVTDLLDDIFTVAVDPAVCPVLASQAGSYPEGVTIGPDGDLTVPDPTGLGWGRLYDCPPYAPTT